MVSTHSSNPMTLDEDGLPALIEPKPVGYREPAGHAPPEPPARFFIVYIRSEAASRVARAPTLVVEEFDLQEEVEARVIELNIQGMTNDAPYVFYGHKSRPKVEVEKLYRVEYK